MYQMNLTGLRRHATPPHTLIESTQVYSENELGLMSLLKETLRNTGITERAAAIYIFLLTKGKPQTARDIKKFMGRNKALVYRSLKQLQAKGIVVSTMTFPARFTAKPLGVILDHAAEAKKREAQLLTKQKKLLCNVIKALKVADSSITGDEFAILRSEHIAVVKGKELAKQTKSDYLVMGDQVASYAVAEDLRVVATTVKRKKARFRFITNLNHADLNVTKRLIGKIDINSEYIKVRHLDLSSVLFPSFALSDESAIIFKFDTWEEINSKDAQGVDKLLWTNNKALIRLAKLLFNELWDKSIDIRKRIAELENGAER